MVDFVWLYDENNNFISANRELIIKGEVTERQVAFGTCWHFILHTSMHDITSKPYDTKEGALKDLKEVIGDAGN